MGLHPAYSPSFEGIRAALHDRAADLEDAGAATVALAEALELQEAFDRHALDAPPEDLTRMARHFRDMAATRRRAAASPSLIALADLCDWRARPQIDAA
jgi:methionine synthase II (cobalamin-independent)